MRTLVIVNLVAAHGRSAGVWEEIRTVLPRDTGEYDWTVTQRPGHATEIARRAVTDGFERVVALGGDGTVHETVNGLAGSRVTLGVIPAGTGNDFAKSINLPRRPIDAWQAIERLPVRCIDLGKVNDRYYVNVAGVGFDAEVSGEVNTRIRATGVAAYLLGILRVLPRFTPVPIKVTLDEQTIEQRCLLVSVGNGKYYGGGLKICPEAIPDDGLFDVVVGGDFGRLETLAVLPRVFSGTHVTHPKVKTYRVRRVHVESALPLWIQADGEVIGRTPATFELIPKALYVAGSQT
ncbi:MAG TPA: diacylglycerol kinase family protein [Bacillota bacterium]